MVVKIVAKTMPETSAYGNNLEEFTAFVARVSNPSNQNMFKTAKRLVTYLAENKHWSPFEMSSVVMEIKTTRDIARQILRHRSFAFQEFSQRYAAVTDEAVIREARLQDTKNRQNSIETEDFILQKQWEIEQRAVVKVAQKAYQWALDNGIAKEQARVVLPEGNTPSVIYMAGTLRSWIHYIQLRSGNGTQKEHREIAIACNEEMKKIGFTNILESVNEV